MKQTIAIAILFMTALSAVGQMPQVTISKDLDSTPGMNPAVIREIKLWKNLQSGDYGAFKAALAPDFSGLAGALPQNRDQFVAHYKACKTGNLNLQNYSTRFPTPNTVVVSSRLHIERRCGKQDATEDSKDTTTWVLSAKKKWLIQHHTASPITTPPQ